MRAFSYSRCDTPDTYVVEPRTPGDVRCYVRKVGCYQWATAPATADGPGRFTTCPVSSASLTRAGAVQAFQFFHR